MRGRALLGTAVALCCLAEPSLGQQASHQPPQDDRVRSDIFIGRNQDEVVVTGTRTERLQRESAVRTDVIGDTVLRLAAPRNLADALEYLPGARAESNCQNCNTTEIQLLGLPGVYNQILFDGLPLLSGVSAVYGVEQIPAVLIDRIEVVKGGASALYGPGAVAGVVNVIPRRIGRTGLRATLAHERPGGEPYVLASAAGTYAPGAGGSGVTLFGHFEDATPVDFNGDGYTELVDRQLRIGGGRGRLALGRGGVLSADYQYVSEDRRGGNRLDRPAFLSNIAEAIDTRLHRGSISYEQALGADAAIVGTYSFAITNRSSFYGGLGAVETDPADSGFDQAALDAAAAVSRNQYGRTDDDLHYAELRGQGGLGRHALIGGVQYRYEKVDDRNVDVAGRFIGQLARDAFDNLGVFVQDEWSLADTVKLLLSGRVDWSSELDHPVFSPRVGLWWSPTEALVLRTNLSTGFRAPEVFSEDLHIDTLGGAPIRVRNAPGLKEESSLSLSAGFDWRPAFGNGAFTLDGQAYYTELRDTFFLGDISQGADGGLFRLRSNVGGSTILGGEISASYRAADWLQGTFGIAYIDARYNDPQLVFEDDDNRISIRHYLKSPDLTAVAQIVAEPIDRLTAFLALRYLSTMTVLNNRSGALVRTPDFVVADLTLTRHIPVGPGGDIDLSFGVKNLFDARQRDLEAGAARDSDFVYGPRLPRTVFVRLDAAF
jgi:outer membrane receptor for ferrienterochelin and colicins